MRNVSEKSCKENHNTYFLFNVFFFFENHVVNGIKWKNIVDPDRPQRTILPTPIACYILKATNAHSE
jgi:hypothetical protein